MNDKKIKKELPRKMYNSSPVFIPDKCLYRTIRSDKIYNISFGHQILTIYNFSCCILPSVTSSLQKSVMPGTKKYFLSTPIYCVWLFWIIIQITGKSLVWFLNPNRLGLTEERFIDCCAQNLKDLCNYLQQIDKMCELNNCLEQYKAMGIVSFLFNTFILLKV